MHTALVTDGEERAALAIVRSLGAAGYRCIVTSHKAPSLAGVSRATALEIRAPSAAADPAGYIEFVAAQVEANKIDVLLPVTEASLLALLPHRESLPCALPFPSAPKFREICNKEFVLARAGELGIRVPRQRTLATPADFVSGPAGYPLVLKPSRSVITDSVGHRRKVGVSWARSEAELRDSLRSYPPEAYPILVQETIQGPGVGVFLLISKDEVLARFAHRRIREKPPAGGVSVVRQSEKIDPGCLEASLRLLRSLDWSGVVMVEYKRDVRTGELVLMEVNGRFWGSLQLAIDAGVDFPRLLTDLSMGADPAAVATYEFVRSRWFWGDVDHLIARWRDREASWREKGRALAGWLAGFGPGYKSEVFRWDDPKPFIRETAKWFSDALPV